MELLGIGNSDILLGSLDEFLSQLLLEFRRGPVDLHVFQVFVEFELVELFLLETPRRSKY